MDLQGIGARIREKRDEQKMTQEQLAAALGVSQTTIHEWERGRAIRDEHGSEVRIVQPPRTAILPRLCAVLGCTAAWLLGEDAGADDKAAANG